MSRSIERAASRIAISMSRARNRGLLVDLLADYDVVEFTDAVPAETDMCIVDDHAVATAGDSLADWKHDQRPVTAPVLLVTEASGGEPWARYSRLLGEVIDAIQPVPAPKAAIKSRVDALLETRRFSLELSSERRLTDRIFETSPIAKTVLDTEGAIVRANERATEIFGLTKTEIAGRDYDSPAWNIVDEHGDTIPAEDLPFARVLDTGVPVFDYEHGIERPDGGRVWLSVNMAPLRDEQGGIEYVVAAIEDITQRKRLERELRESEELHRATLSNIRDAIFITDDTGAFTYVCPNTRFIFRNTQEEIRELGNIEDILGDDLVGDETLTEGAEFQNIERVIEDAEGTEHTVLISINPVDIQGGTRLYTVRDITERKRQEARFRAFVEHSSDIVTVVSNTGEIRYVSPSVERVLGYPPSELQGANVFEYTHPEDQSRLLDALETVRTQGDGEDVVSVEFRTRHADGSWRWVESRATVEATPNGGYVINTRDISEYREAKSELEDHATHLEQAQEIANIGSWYIDLETMELDWSDEIYRIFELPLQQPITYEDFLEHVHPEDRDLVNENWAAALLGAEYEIEHRIQTDSGMKWVRESAEIAFDGDLPTHALGVVQDITQQKSREQRLVELEESRSLALSASNAGIWEWDLDTGRIDLHESSERLFGLDPGEFGGTFEAYLEQVHPDDREMVEQIYSRAVRGSELSGVTYRIRREDGLERWVHGRWALQSDASGTPIRLIGVNVDVTEHQERIKHLRVLDDVLRHNFRNHMNLIRGYAETVEEESSGMAAEHAAKIIEGSDRLLSTTDKQREITKILSEEPRHERLDLVTIVHHIASDIQSDHPDVLVETDLPETAFATASRDIGRAIEELARNAIRHNDRPDKVVGLSVDVDPEAGIEIRVSDNGPGIPEMEQKVVTGERGLEPLYHGSGLGLWLVSWIVRRSEGTLTFETAEDGGTVVTIRLPTAAPAVITE